MRSFSSVYEAVFYVVSIHGEASVAERPLPQEIGLQRLRFSSGFLEEAVGERDVFVVRMEEAGDVEIEDRLGQESEDRRRIFVKNGEEGRVRIDERIREIDLPALLVGIDIRRARRKRRSVDRSQNRVLRLCRGEDLDGGHGEQVDRCRGS